MQRLIVLVTLAVLLAASAAGAKTLILEGGLNSRIAMRQAMEFTVDRGEVESFTFRFALPADFKSRSVSQSVAALQAAITPQPSSSEIEEDKFGNRFQKVVWNNLTSTIRINLNYTAQISSELSAMESRTPFPIGSISDADALYLQSTGMVQSDDARISELARRLTAGAKNEYEAVSAITNHVSDFVKYTFNPPQYDALYTLETRSGNCQNFAHLNIALLRSVGIPARIVGGITLKDSWKVPIDSKNTIVQSMGQGGHAWIEIFFSDLGWLPYDPQQSRQFTSSRHIKQSHGLDSRDINDTWRGVPYLPRYSELIEGSFLADTVKLAVKSTGKDPRSYIISNLVASKIAASAPVVAVPVPGVAKEKPDRERSAREKAEREKLERAERERVKKEQAERQRLEKERLKQEQAERQRREQERLKQERAEQQRLEQERLRLARAEQERLKAERAEQQRLEQERLRLERAEQERLKAERLAALKAEQERRAQEQSEKDRLARERQEAERVARLKAEQEQKARQDAENKRLAFEKAEAERIASLKAEQERVQRLEAENKRLARERAEAERLAFEKAEQERKARQEAEEKRIALEKAEAERVARLKAEQEQQARQEAEKKRLALEKAEAERIAGLKKEPPPIQKPPAPPRGSAVVFGNMEFPNLVDSYSVQGNVGTRILDKETSEYVTSQYIFAQAFNLKNSLELDTVSLAMRKFGGDGNVYVDLVRDDNGRPNILDGVRSQMVPLEGISRKPGYYWVDFAFANDAQSRLKPGKYWIVLRTSGEAIMNWFYIPGKPYSDSDDTRSTAKGFQWEDIRTYDFVFKVSGKAL